MSQFKKYVGVFFLGVLTALMTQVGFYMVTSQDCHPIFGRSHED